MRNLYTKFNVTPESLVGCRFFDDLPQEDRSRIARHCEGRRYREGASIVTYGETTQDVFFLCSGHVRASVICGNRDGSDIQELTSQDLRGGEMFGELSAIDQEPRSTNVVAVEESSVLRMSGQSFREIIASVALLNERTQRRLCALSRYLCSRSIEARTRRIPEQIALEIMRVVSADAHEGTRWTIDPAPKHHEIASRVGTYREQVTRVVSRLARDKLIERTRGGRSWAVPDGPALLRHLSGPPAR